MQLLPLIWLAITFFGCGQRREGSFATTENGKWAYADTLYFPCDSGATGKLVSLALRYNDSYPYRSISIVVELWDTLGVRTQLDTVNMELNDATGSRLGSGFGGSYQIEKNSKIFYPSDSCLLKVYHIMKSDTIDGIEMVGVMSAT